MMRFTGTIGTWLAALAVVPASALGPQDSRGPLVSLESALADTVHALELLAGFSAPQAAPVAMTVVREVTEEPIPAGPARDERLDLLRNQVSLLQQQLDLVEQRLRDGASGESANALLPAPGVTKGLDTRALARLGALGASPTAENAAADTSAPLVETYSADPLLQAQACYRAGQYERGALLLANDTTAAGLYWRARSLEKLERLDEAASLYTAVAARADAGSLTERARTNLEFLAWRKAFAAKLQDEPSSQTAKEPKR